MILREMHDVRVHVALLLLLWLYGGVASAQCPDITGSASDPVPPQTLCLGDQVVFSVTGDQLPDGGTIDWYIDPSNGFDAYSGEGSFIGSSNIIMDTCAGEIEVLYLMVNPDNGEVGGPGDRCDEFIVIWTGSGGFTPNDILISNLGVGSDEWDDFDVGNTSTFDCGTALGPNDMVPANAILIIQSDTKDLIRSVPFGNEQH